jgi:hypothetical protein
MLILRNKSRYQLLVSPPLCVFGSFDSIEEREYIYFLISWIIRLNEDVNRNMLHNTILDNAGLYDIGHLEVKL